jgi:hypothetical protein
LGANIDIDSASLASATANGDDTNVTSDDEDGITLPNLTAGATSYSIPAANINLTNTSGSPATLHAWVDFNKNGTFEAIEYTSTTVSTGTSGGNPTSGLSWSRPIGASGNTFARFRLTTDATVSAKTPSGAATSGEVEDYQVAIVAGSPNFSISPDLCPITGYLIRNNPSQISIYNLATGEFGSSTTITGVDSNNTILNAVGFNPLDGYMYALEDGAGADGDLYRLDQSGNAVKIGKVANLTFLNYNAGDVDANGYYYVSATNRPRIEIIDVNPARTATYGKRVGHVTLPTGALSGPDLAINLVDGRLYTIHNDTKDLWSFKIDGATQTLTSSINHGKTTTITPTGSIGIVPGAMYFDINGNFYAFDNNGNGLFKFPTKPTVSTVGQYIGQGGGASLNDGARCALAALGVDYGDAPDTGSGTGRGNYQTLAGNNGPSHDTKSDYQIMCKIKR